MYFLCIDQLYINVTQLGPFDEGGIAQFTATASGVNMKNFKYQWQKRGSNLPDKVSDTKQAVLIIPNLVKPDEGEYYCTVTNEWNNTVSSENVTLSVEGMLH